MKTQSMMFMSFKHAIVQRLIKLLSSAYGWLILELYHSHNLKNSIINVVPEINIQPCVA